MPFKKQTEKNERIIKTACSSHCGGECLLNVHVCDDKITRIESDSGEEPQLRACLRCRAYRQRVYDPKRVKYPMKRTGKRGEGKFERISWDEALDRIVLEVNRVRKTYGPSSFFFAGGGADAMLLQSYRSIAEVFSMTGGFTRQWGNQSFEGGAFASMATYGSMASIGTHDDLLNSKLIILWGINPAVTIQRTNTTWYLARAKESGTKIICVDPRHTETAAALSDQWIPILPGTDAAMLIAMAYVIVTENLQDQTFLDKYTVGFDMFKDYILGHDDGISKTPSWAEAVTGVPGDVIVGLAREYATVKPAALIAGIGPGRSAYGEQYHRAAEVLSAMTGNTGIHGGWAGKMNPIHFGGYMFKLGMLPRSKGNPVESGALPRENSLPTAPGSDNGAKIHFSDVADAILKGRAGGFPADIKMMMIMQTNFLNQVANSNKTAKALRKLEFVVVAEQAMTSTAMFADILIPISTFMERNDLTLGGATPHYGFVNKVIEPLHESRSPFQILAGLAERLGVDAFSSKTEDEWLKHTIEGSSDIPDYETFKKEVIHRVKLEEPIVGFKKQINDPDNNPFPTPSGKIEIYSSKLAEMKDPSLPPLPKYIEAWEGKNDPLAQKYPLQLITTHFKRRTHTQYDSLPWLRELVPQAVTMNTTDAGERGIKDADMVRVFNERGKIIVPAVVTERIMPGVIDLPQGAWYSPDENGVDRGGCANTLTKDKGSPGGAACHNTGLVQVLKVK
jgi:anaerobic dimethyl sulfoxide reductase subunit A